MSSEETGMRRKKANVWVSMNNYTWAVYRYPNRNVLISHYLDNFSMELVKPGFSVYPSRKRFVRINNEALERKSQRS